MAKQIIKTRWIFWIYRKTKAVTQLETL